MTSTQDSRMRLDRFVSHCASLSRSQVRKLLHADCITVDGVAERDPARSISPNNVVALHGTLLPWPRSHYVMLNKPAGFECSTEAIAHPLVGSLIDQNWAGSLHTAGRLDVDSTGLVLLTDDGAWSHALTSPRRNCFKTYLVGTKHPLTDAIVPQFAAGLLLNGEDKPTLPAQVEILDTRIARVRVQEGRYHQVKRMFAACSNRVESLHREAIGAIVLDALLQPGQWRELTDSEIGASCND